jgi:hypothetical protein
MGFYTQLIFNEIEIPKESLLPLQDSARKISIQKDCPWSYMLKFLYVESSEGDIIDLQISKEMKKALTKLHGKPPTPINKVQIIAETDTGDEEAVDPWYMLAWHSFDGGPWGKWYHAEGFASWIGSFCDGGQIFQMTLEEGGGLWGWEFFDCMFRELQLKPKGRWMKCRPSCTPRRR